MSISIFIIYPFNFYHFSHMQTRKLCILSRKTLYYHENSHPPSTSSTIPLFITSTIHCALNKNILIIVPSLSILFCKFFISHKTISTSINIEKSQTASITLDTVWLATPSNGTKQ